MSLRQAALIAGFAYLLDPVGYAEFTLYPRLVIPGNVEATVANIGAHGPAFVAIIFCYLVNFIEDVVIAWALYYLLAPVNKPLSSLTAIFRLVYTAMGLFGLSNLVTVYRILNAPEYVAATGRRPLDAQVDLLLHSFRYDYLFGLIVFGIHLCLLGYLVYRSGYTGFVSKIVGVVLAVTGLGWIVLELRPYLFPAANIDWVFYTVFGELIFMLWLLIGGWMLKAPNVQIERS